MEAAQLSQYQQENEGLRGMLRSMSGQAQAMKQSIDEMLMANVNLRSSNLLLEDDVKVLKANIEQYVQRIVELEKENNDLRVKQTS